MTNHLRFALRMLVAHPGFTLVTTLTLALGIGVNTAMFSVVDALLLRPLPLPAPGRLLRIATSNPGRPGAAGPFSIVAFENLRDHNDVFSGIAAFVQEGFSLTGVNHPEQLQGARVAANFFDVLQAKPFLGRTFQTSEGQSGSAPVALISYSLWQRRFSSDPSIAGKPINLGQQIYTIIGVMPPAFPFPFAGTDVWTTQLANFTGLSPDQVRNGGGFLTAVARLKDGVSETQAAAQLDVLNRQYRQDHPGYPDADPRGTLDATPLQDSLIGALRPTLLILSGAVGLVLLIACANVASLLLARAGARSREIAIRAALGAGRGGLIRQLLIESVVLSMLGAAVGTLLAIWGVAALVQSAGGNLPGFQPIAVNLRVLAFTLAISVATGIAFGLMPALEFSRPDLNVVLRDSGWGTTSGRARGRSRSILVAGQMALSMVLLIGAALLIESFRRLETVSPGFDPRHALTLRVSLPPAGYPTDPRRTQFVREWIRRSESLPGVTAVAASSSLPLAGGIFAPYLAEGQPLVPIGQRPVAAWNSVTPDYFKTLAIPLVRGRAFTWNDDDQAPPRVIVSESLARRFWPNEDPIGKHIFYARRAVLAEIVGVAADVKTLRLDADPGMIFYTPYAQFAWPGISLTLRTAADPRAYLRTAPALVFALDPNLPVITAQTTEELVAQNISGQRDTMMLIGGFAIAAMLLAVVGLYGLIAYSVVQRTTEIGIRQAIGAGRADVLWMFLAEGSKLSLIGIAIGTASALASGRLLSGLLFHTSAADPWIYAAIALLFFIVTLAASAIPALRATRIDPIEALRIR